MGSSTYISWRLKRVESSRRQRNTIFSFSFSSCFFLFLYFVQYHKKRSCVLGVDWVEVFCHLLKLRPRSRSFFVVFKYREERRSDREAERWWRHLAAATLIMCRVHPSLCNIALQNAGDFPAFDEFFLTLNASVAPSI